MKSFILVADILGFSNVVSNLPPDNLSERMDAWVCLVQQTKCDTKIDRVKLVSDTIFAQVADSEDGMKRLFRFSKLLLERGLENSFFIRGAISHGEASWSNELIFGKAVLDAHRLESSLDWVGIACTEIDKELPWSWDLACRYPAPQKGREKVLSVPVIVWTPPDSFDILDKWDSRELHDDDTGFFWADFSKLSNTSIFFKYVRDSERKGLEPHKFHLGIFLNSYLP